MKKQNTSIHQTLADRGNKYGTFVENAKIVQGLMRVIEESEKADQLTEVHKEALHMIFHKIARMVCGDCMYLDTIHDVVGYASLLEKSVGEMEDA